MANMPSFVCIYLRDLKLKKRSVMLVDFIIIKGCFYCLVFLSYSIYAINEGKLQNLIDYRSLIEWYFHLKMKHCVLVNGTRLVIAVILCTHPPLIGSMVILSVKD